MAFPEKHVIVMPLAQTTAGTNDLYVTHWPFAAKGTLESAAYSCGSAVTANDTNYADISVELGGTEVCSEQTTTGDTGNIAALALETLALTASGVSLEVSEGESIEAIVTKAGSGVAVLGSVRLIFSIDRE